MPLPVPRLAARVLLLDEGSRILLFRGGDPAAPERGTWWFTPGGGLEPGETRHQGAARELFEETGLRVSPDSLGEPVLCRRVEQTMPRASASFTPASCSHAGLA